MEKKSGSGSEIRDKHLRSFFRELRKIPYLLTWELRNSFGLKYQYFNSLLLNRILDLFDPGSGIRDGKIWRGSWALDR